MPRGTYNAERLYAITRLRFGWVVRLVRDNERFEKSFSDRIHGGKPAALEYATRWRDQMIRDHTPIPRLQKMMRPRGGSGPIPGVTRELDADGNVRLWRVKTYVREGQVLQKTFSVSRYGSAAQQMAVDERHRHLKHIEGLSWVHPDESSLRQAAVSAEELPATPTFALTHQVARSANTSGFPGVVRRSNHWTAQTTLGGRWVSQSFRVDQYGEEVALILAIWARLDQLSSHDPSTKSD